jgi:hypothetical protein
MMLAGSGGVDVFVKIVGEPRHVVSALNLATGKALIVTDFRMVSWQPLVLVTISMTLYVSAPEKE